MKAMILCAGRGTRLGNLTQNTPKVLLPVGSEPAIIHVLNWLGEYSILDIVINLYHLGNQIKDYLGDLPNIKYTHEVKLSGTAGGVKNAKNLLGDTFLVVNGDTLTNFNLSSMIKFHGYRKALATIALCSIEQLNEGGLVQVGVQNRISGFVENPTTEVRRLVNAGVYILDHEIFSYIPNGFSDFGYNIFPQIIRLGLPIYGYILDKKNYVVDIGTPAGYERARRIYDK